MAENKLQSLTEIFNEKIFRIPDFQRGYSWENNQLEDFWEDLRAEATKYVIPSSEDDKAGIKNIQPFLEQGDKYTGIYIYALKEGNYIT